MGSTSEKFELSKSDRSRVDRTVKLTCLGLVIASFLFAWLLSLWSWWSIVGAIWVGVGICFGIMLLNICLDWKLKFPKEQEGDAVEQSPVLAEYPVWFPIETAPKDGTEVLGWREDAGVFLMRYYSPTDVLSENELEELSDQSAEQSDWWAADSVYCAMRMEGSEVPTHWMPLPRPPIC